MKTPNKFRECIFSERINGRTSMPPLLGASGSAGLQPAPLIGQVVKTGSAVGKRQRAPRG